MAITMNVRTALRPEHYSDVSSIYYYVHYASPRQARRSPSPIPDDKVSVTRSMSDASSSFTLSSSSSKAASDRMSRHPQHPSLSPKSSTSPTNRTATKSGMPDSAPTQEGDGRKEGQSSGHAESGDGDSSDSNGTSDDDRKPDEQARPIWQTSRSVNFIPTSTPAPVSLSTNSPTADVADMQSKKQPTETAAMPTTTPADQRGESTPPFPTMSGDKAVKSTGTKTPVEASPKSDSSLTKTSASADTTSSQGVTSFGGKAEAVDSNAGSLLGDGTGHDNIQSSRLTGAPIAGIVIGVIAALSMALLLLLFCLRRRRGRRGMRSEGEEVRPGRRATTMEETASQRRPPSVAVQQQVPRRGLAGLEDNGWVYVHESMGQWTVERDPEAGSYVQPLSTPRSAPSNLRSAAHCAPVQQTTADQAVAITARPNQVSIVDRHDSKRRSTSRDRTHRATGGDDDLNGEGDSIQEWPQEGIKACARWRHTLPVVVDVAPDEPTPSSHIVTADSIMRAALTASRYSPPMLPVESRSMSNFGICGPPGPQSSTSHERKHDRHPQVSSRQREADEESLEERRESYEGEMQSQQSMRNSQPTPPSLSVVHNRSSFGIPADDSHSSEAKSILSVDMGVDDQAATSDQQYGMRVKQATSAVDHRVALPSVQRPGLYQQRSRNSRRNSFGITAGDRIRNPPTNDSPMVFHDGVRVCMHDDDAQNREGIRTCENRQHRHHTLERLTLAERRQRPVSELSLRSSALRADAWLQMQSNYTSTFSCSSKEDA